MHVKIRSSLRSIRTAYWLMLSALLFSCAPRQALDRDLAGTAGTVGSLQVAVYPYVPRKDQFVTAIREAWQGIHPEVALEFVDYDCYAGDPPDTLDVYVFDAIFLKHLWSFGFLEPLTAEEIHNMEDFLPYARDGCRIGDRYLGIPQLGCGSMLFYRNGDEELAGVETLSELELVIQECMYSGEVPPEDTGLMIDLSGGTTNACFYLSASESIYGVYTNDPPLPLTTENLDGWAITNVQNVLRLASRAQATYSNFEQPYLRGEWFAEGSGRALVAYTEFMSAMGNQVDNVSFKLLPLSYRPNSVSLFYADVIGINPKAIGNDPERRGLALELANLMASKEVMVDSIGPTETAGPQYLMPTRPSVFQELGATYPQYNRMYTVVTSGKPGLFVMGVDSRFWLENMRLAIREAIYAEACPE